MDVSFATKTLEFKGPTTGAKVFSQGSNYNDYKVIQHETFLNEPAYNYIINGGRFKVVATYYTFNINKEGASGRTNTEKETKSEHIVDIEWVDGWGENKGKFVSLARCGSDCISTLKKRPNPPQGLRLGTQPVPGGGTTNDGTLIWNAPVGEKGVDYNGFKFYYIKGDQKEPEITSGKTIPLTDIDYDPATKTFKWNIQGDGDKGAPPTIGLQKDQEYKFYLFSAVIDENTGSVACRYDVSELFASCRGVVTWSKPIFRILNTPSELPLSIIKNFTYSLESNVSQNAKTDYGNVGGKVHINMRAQPVPLMYGNNKTANLQVISLPVEKNSSFTVKLAVDADYGKEELPLITITDAVKINKSWMYLTNNTPMPLEIDFSSEVPSGRKFKLSLNNSSFYLRKTAGGSNLSELIVTASAKTTAYLYGPAGETENVFNLNIINCSEESDYSSEEKGFNEYENGKIAAYPLEIKARDCAFFDSLHFAFSKSVKTFNVSSRIGKTSSLRVKTLFGAGEVSIRENSADGTGPWYSEINLNPGNSVVDIRGIDNKGVEHVSKPNMNNIRVEIVEDGKVVFFEDIEVVENIGIKTVPFLVRSEGSLQSPKNAACILVEAAEGESDVIFTLTSSENVSKVYASFLSPAGSTGFNGFSSTEEFIPTKLFRSSDQISIKFGALNGRQRKRYIPVVAKDDKGTTLPGVWSVIKSSAGSANKRFKVLQTAGIEHFDCVLENTGATQNESKRKVYIAVDETKDFDFKFRNLSGKKESPELIDINGDELMPSSNRIHTGYYYIKGKSASSVNSSLGTDYISFIVMLQTETEFSSSFSKQLSTIVPVFI